MNRQAARRLSRARSILIQDQPYFGTLALNLRPVERADIETMATDGAHLFYSPRAVLEWPEPELIAVVAHEVLHCALGHHARLMGRDLAIANRAADYVINAILRAAGFRLWAGHLYDARFEGMGFEEVYSILAREKRKADQPKPGQGKPDAGAPQPGADGGKPGAGQDGAGDAGNPSSGAGKPGNDPSGQDGAGQGPGAPGKPGQGEGRPLPGADVLGDGGIVAPGDGSAAAARESAEQWEVISRQAVAAAGKLPGADAGALNRIAGEMARTTVDVRDILARFIDSMVSTDYSFNRPNRRHIHSGMILPGATVDGLEHLIFAVDTSGSIDGHMLRNAAGVIAEAAEGGKVQRLTIVWADADVQGVQEFNRGDDIAAGLRPKGGGGTRFAPTFDWIERNAPDATAVIYLTDMECRSWGEDPGIPVLWAVHGDSRRFDTMAARAPFGDAVYVGRLE